MSEAEHTGFVQWSMLKWPISAVERDLLNLLALINPTLGFHFCTSELLTAPLTAMLPTLSKFPMFSFESNLSFCVFPC